jgi:hypothetical protein
MSRIAAAVATSALVLGLFAAVPSGASDGTEGAPATCQDTFCAGAASVDMTWHVGSGQGQLGGGGNAVSADRFDPYHHSTKMVPTEGIQSRTFAKSLVVRGADGTKVAYVKTELYLQQDQLSRRVLDLVTGQDPLFPELAVPGLGRDAVLLGATHNHSAPHYISTAWGVWVFADAFDFRMFEHTARAIAQSIVEADAALEPAVVGASVTEFREVQQNILGPAVALDGSPAGFPRDHFDPELSVVRVDAAADGAPIGALVNLALHPESLGGVDLVSSDFVGMVERMVERDLGREPGTAGGHREGPVVAWSQAGLGDVEPDRDRAVAEGRQYWRRDFAQAERMSRVIADAVLDTHGDIAAGTPGVPEKFVPLTADAPVAVVSETFSGPIAHPAPTVSNCRTERPGVPVAGLPDCQSLPEAPGYGSLHQLLRDAGVPVPDNYGVPAYKSVQESLVIGLQALRIGDILLATCACEPITDMALNFKTRADDREGNQHLGYEWPCEEPAEDATTVACDFRDAPHKAPAVREVDRDAYELMQAQIRNDAAGWEDDLASLQSESAPTDPAEVYGNFTHDELGEGSGYRLPLMVGMAGDYIGYVVTYREHERGDHYRKALTAYGPHTADYINTRLVAMAAALKGDTARLDDLDALDPLTVADDVSADTSARVIGLTATGGLEAYEAALPDDGGVAGTVLAGPPAELERFGAAALTWQGGSNWTDNPVVTVERFLPGRRGQPAQPGRPSEGTPPGNWQTVGTQEGGEVVVTMAYDSYRSAAPAEWLAGEKTYEWTATYEAFDATEPGRYRFVVEGAHRSGRQPVPYALTSDEFAVLPWTGLLATDLRRDGGAVSFTVAGVEAQLGQNATPGPIRPVPGDAVRYPFTYEGPASFQSSAMEVHGSQRYCFRCTFRPWAAEGRVVEAEVTVERAAGGTTTHLASFDGERFTTGDLALEAGDRVLIAPGGLVDEHGNTNGTAHILQD